MNRLLPTAGISLVLFILGGLLSLTELASFLDQSQNQILFHLMPVKTNASVCRLTIPDDCRADDVAKLMLSLKVQRTKGIILIGKIGGAGESVLFGEVVADTNVVWVLDPQLLDFKLSGKARTLPLLHLQNFSSVVIANSTTNGVERSAALLALSCTGDAATAEIIGCNELKIPYSRSSYAANGADTNFTLVCITKEDVRDKYKYVTPAGVRTKSEYLLDICDSLISRRFLIESSRAITIPVIVLAALLFGFFKQARQRLCAFVIFWLVLMSAALITKYHLPICEVTLVYLASLIVIPVLENWMAVKSSCLLGLAAFFKSVPSVLGTLLLLSAFLWEFFFQHYEHDQASQFLAVAIFSVFIYLAKDLRPEQRSGVERNLVAVFIAVGFFMALMPHFFQPAPGMDAYYRNVARWRGWTIDPNNSAIVVGLCGILAFNMSRSLEKALQPFFVFVAVVCIIQLFRSYSRIGLLSAAIGTCLCLAPKWGQVSEKLKVRILYLLLLSVAAVPFAISWLHDSQNLLIRRALSFTNFMDLSWANRLYVLPGTIQAAWCKPLLGWGWGNVLQAHRKLFCPTFLNDNTAILLNDYAHIAASYGLVVFGFLVFIIAWGLLVKNEGQLKIFVVVGAVAMFFQGVIRIPIVLIPFSLSLAMIFAEAPPWRVHGWKSIRVLPYMILPVGVFLIAWCVFPSLGASNSIYYRANQYVVSNANRDKLVVAFVSDGNVLARGRQARAASSLGATSILTGAENIQSLKEVYGSRIWFLGVTNEVQSLKIENIQIKSDSEIGVWAVRMAYDAGQNEVPMCPDKPFDLAWVVAALFFSGAIFIVANIFFISRNRIMALMAGTAALVAIFYSKTAHDDWIVENQETADYARQMRSAVIPDDIYFAYVLNPDISQNFRIRHRREIWHTFYQTSRAENLAELIEKLKESINLQFLIRPEDSQSLGSFETLWQNRSCNLHERWYLLAAVLRTLDVPARLSQDRLQVWDADGWHDVAR